MASNGNLQDPSVRRMGHTAAHQRLVLADPLAFRYLEEDPSTTVIERHRRLPGYEVHVIEQWACSRIHPTFAITTYTGLDQHSILVSVLSVPTDEEKWSPRLKVYLRAITRYHARKKDTPLGILMVTNLSAFPSALNVISVPSGDVKAHRLDFNVNENLKRMGCSGRAGLNLATPTSATQAKFRDLYHTSSEIAIQAAVIELVKLCQAALILYGLLDMNYADGLLCDITERAVNDWWADIGSDQFNVDPNDGVLGPTTVAAMLGLLMGARKRLSVYGAPVAKDVFDIASTKRAIGYFQKTQKLERTRRLDRPTLERLHIVTARQANSESWAVQRAVKSTVAELSGKGNDLMNGKERAGIAEVETLHIDDFIRLGSGERFKWLWYGKPRKDGENNIFGHTHDDLSASNNMSPSTPALWNIESNEIGSHLNQAHSDRLRMHTSPSPSSLDAHGADQGRRKAALKNMSEKVTDAKSGLGRIRNAVSRKGHGHKPSRDANTVFNDDSLDQSTGRDSLEERPDDISDPNQSGKGFMTSGEPSTAGSNESSRRNSRTSNDIGTMREHQGNERSPKASNTSRSQMQNEPSVSDRERSLLDDNAFVLRHANGITSRNTGRRATADQTCRTSSLTGQDFDAVDRMEHFEWNSSTISPLRSTVSVPSLIDRNKDSWKFRWPRRMSDSVMIDVALPGSTRSMAFQEGDLSQIGIDTALADESIMTLEAQKLDRALRRLRSSEASWVEEKVAELSAYNRQCSTRQSKIEDVYHQKLTDDHEMQQYIHGLMAGRKASLTDGLKDVEVLDAKLEYELQALQSKLEDVESGVAEYERQVLQLEERIETLRNDELPNTSWQHRFWSMRIF